MAAKPWALSHVAAVASSYTDLRISGAVKDDLVQILVKKIDEIVPRMEDETLAQDAGRKTLDDPQRTRLGFNRTKGLMTERIGQVDSVGAAAVTAACEELEGYLGQVLRACETVCTNQSMGTIKPRHLEEALSNMGVSSSSIEDEAILISPSSDEDNRLESMLGGQGSVMTPALMRQMVKKFAGMKVESDALEEMLDLYYEEAGDIQYSLKSSVIGGNPADFIPSLERLDDLAKMGWLHRNLKNYADRAKESGSNSIKIEHILD